MKLLLSAYACEPGKGSEPGVGWQWALETARLGHEVWTLTRANNRTEIEKWFAGRAFPGNLRFIYYDLPSWARWWKRGNRGIHLYYLLWQWGAYLAAKRIHEVEKFDRVHHVTFVSVRQPSFMGNLGIPFVFGPVGGGERSPWRLRWGCGWRGLVRDGIRDLANMLARIDPAVRRTFRQAHRIYVTSEETRQLIPGKYRRKALVRFSIGYPSSELPEIPEAGGGSRDGKSFGFLYVGRLLYWKGLHLGLAAFDSLLKEFPNARMTIVGSGKDEARLRALAEKSGSGDRIEWSPWVDRGRLRVFYSTHKVFLFPSLHDSGGMAVLEAMAHGLPVVCLDLGGPARIVDKSCGLKVMTCGLREKRIVGDLKKAMVELAKNSSFYNRLSKGAFERVKKFGWQQVVSPLYADNI